MGDGNEAVLNGAADHVLVDPPPPVRIEATLTPRLNLAFHQNAVPVLRELVLVNDSDAALEAVELTLTSEPAFLAPKSWRIDAVPAGQRYHVPRLDVALDGAMLGRLTEAESATVTITAMVAGTAEPLARIERPRELLARNQWGGVGHIPEMIAAFVQPNDPAVERVLKTSADILRQHGRSGALNGYDGGPKRAWELAAALWGAVGGLGLDYALPPPSFEHAGQKVRGPSQILDSGLATCLDSALLFAAALEHCGLNPLLVFTRGHAFAGVWLRHEEFTTPVVDDVTALRKRVKLKELVLFETTLVTQRPCPSFAAAADHAVRQIEESVEDGFELAVDIRRARLQRIRPLASAEAPPAVEVAWAPAAEPAVPLFAEPPPDLPDERDEAAEAESGQAAPKDRLEHWQRKLLDLSLRNALLNFRAGKRAILCDAPDPGLLEDLLAEGRALRLLPRPLLMDGDDPRSQAIHEGRTLEDLHRRHALEALGRNEILVGLKGVDLDARLTDLYRTARAALQEGGANTLFLALGFLSWTRDAGNPKRHRAPLILVPVTLQRKSVRSGFSLALHDDEPRFNPTLLQMLRQDFRLSIPVGEGDLPRDGNGLDIAGIWKAVGLAVKEIPGWEVAEEVVLGTFSFAKHLMWKDLVDRTEQLKQNPVVRHLIETPRDPFPSPTAFPDPRRLDATHGPEHTFCPLPADSSQLAAVMAAARGKSFVLVGPPGTGKSQTIANLIAQFLAERKTVLFVSEKIAALDVVYRRLRGAGLGEFCLELHSSKSRKLDVLDQLRRAWEAKGDVDAEVWNREAQRLKGLRDQLNVFVERLHHRHRNGLTVHTALGRVVTGRGRPPLGLAWPSVGMHDEAALDGLRELADRLALHAREVGSIADSPLRLVTRADFSSHWRQGLIGAARGLMEAGDALTACGDALIRAIGLPGRILDRKTRTALAGLAAILPRAAGHDWRFALRPDAGRLADRLGEGLGRLAARRALIDALSPPLAETVLQGLRRGLELLARHRDLTGRLSIPYGAGAATLDLDRLKDDWNKAQRSIWPLRGLRSSAVIKALMAAADGRREPDVAADLDRLAALQVLGRELDALAPAVVDAGEVWTGLDTDAEAVQALLAFQTVLPAARSASPWPDGGLDPVAVAEGRCGAAAAADHQRLTALRSLDRDIDDFDDLRTATGGLWNGLRTRVPEVEAALAFQAGLTRAVAGLATTPDELSPVKAPLERLIGDGNALLAGDGPIETAGRAFLDRLGRYDAAVRAFAELSGSGEADVGEADGETPSAVAAACRGILALEPKLHAWCAWRRTRDDAAVQGLAPLIAALEQGRVELDDLRNAFETDYCRWWLDGTVDGDEVLRSFVSAEHEKRISDFRALDDRFTDLTRAYVRAGLCAGLPDQETVGKSSEWGVLRREMQKKRAHMPLRELIGRLPGAVTKLAPCLLMSPLSIAQFLSADTTPFDVVVFDEASQIPVWDAIGAIARGRQVVMVGDPKQLPPTAFFDRAEADEDEDGDVDRDLESILDECLGANLPARSLTWHYRSRHESLIAFSNHRYYEGGLVTFPSPVTDDRAVSLRFVADGLYEKGGARINKPEARALVADLVGRLKDPAFRAAGLTAGVVTFNSEQQRLIEDLLDEERRKAPEIEPHFAEDAVEPVFVKSLESVQGDERDVMYFSITYGPGPAGAVSMNFGPMNRDGGERRLNVAITRARHELRVFSSLRPEQFDLSRTAASGVRDLKHFLEFAERGPRALAEAVQGSVGEHESPFESAVAIALARRGWRLHPQVGVSSFRIDLGVVDPDAPGRYLAGIECDGATYHRSATARDRDKLREQVLRGLGWEIVRVWSTDWWHDHEGALAKLDSRLSALLEASRTRRAEEARRIEEAAAAAELSEAALEEPAPCAETTDETHAADAHPESVHRPADDHPPGGDPTPAAVAYAHNAAVPAPPERTDGFREADPRSVAAAINPDAFFDRDYTATLQSMIAHVITVEGPVRDDVLARRIARAHGWLRTGARIRDRVVTLAQARFPGVQEEAGLFFWPTDADQSVWPAFRRPAGDEARPVDEIALPELVALARAVREEGITGEDAVVAMARDAGLRQLRAASRDRLQRAWGLLTPPEAE